MSSEAASQAQVTARVLFVGGALGVALLLAAFVLLNREIAQRARGGNDLALSVEGLRKQTEIFESILRSMGDGVIVADEKGKFITWNPAAEQILGLGAMDVPMDKLTEKYGFYLPDKTSRYPASQVPLARAVRGEVTSKEEMYVRNDVRPAGVWVSATGTPLRDQAGVMRGGVVVLSEITERKQAEEALIRDAKELAVSVESLRKQTELFQSILSSMGDGVIVADENGKFLNWNPAAEAILGLGAMDVPIDQLTEKYGFYLPDKITPYPASRVPLARAVRGEVANKEEMFVRNDIRPAGVWVSATGTPLRDQAGVMRGGVVVLSEITERKQAEEALIRDAKELAVSVESLRKQTELFQSILSSMGDGVIVADENGKFLNWNPAAEAILGLGAMDVPIDQLTEKYGFYLPDKITPYPASRVPLARAVRGEVANKEEMFVRNDIRPAGVWVSATGTPLRDQAGVMRGGVVVLSEITERKQAEEALIRDATEIRLLNQELEHRVVLRTAELEAINKELESFSYSVAHDLRAPLRHIDGFAKMLEEETLDLTPEGKRFVVRIRASTTHMGRLVDDLLNLARLGRKELNLEPTDLAVLADKVAGELQRETAARSIEWKIGALPLVRCDARLVEQVFINLLSNAAKYSRPRAHAMIEVGAMEMNGDTAIFVRDNGVGFNMKYADKLFGVFQRLHRAEEFEGTGIGLATVQRIINRHGGRIWAEAELDKGSTFYFTLGAKKAESRNQKAEGGETTGAGDVVKMASECQAA